MKCKTSFVDIAIIVTCVEEVNFLVSRNKKFYEFYLYRKDDDATLILI